MYADSSSSSRMYSSSGRVIVLLGGFDFVYLVPSILTIPPLSYLLFVLVHVSGGESVPDFLLQRLRFPILPLVSVVVVSWEGLLICLHAIRTSSWSFSVGVHVSWGVATPAPHTRLWTWGMYVWMISFGSYSILCYMPRSLVLVYSLLLVSSCCLLSR
jgi:hypothetical protein